MPWSTSDRRQRLPKDWPKRRAAVEHRAGGRCEGLSLDGEPRWHADGCDGRGTDCDHIARGDDHSLDNLCWLSGPCHAAKTRRESEAALQAVYAKLRRPQPVHPGLL